MRNSKYNDNLWAFFCHHKCGTTFIDLSILEGVTSALGLKKISAHTPAQFDGDINRFLESHEANFFSYVNAEYGYVEQIDKKIKGFHVIRDPRNVIVSAYFSHRDSHSTKLWPELAELRKKLKNSTTKEGLLLEIDFIKKLTTDGVDVEPLVNMGEWNYKDPRILECKFENLVSDPHAEYRKIFKFLGLVDGPFLESLRKVLPRGIEDRYLKRTLTINQLDYIVEESTRTMKEKRAKGSGHYRKKGSKWQDYFDEDIKSKFKETFPGLVESLGYEDSENW